MDRGAAAPTAGATAVASAAPLLPSPTSDSSGSPSSGTAGLPPTIFSTSSSSSSTPSPSTRPPSAPSLLPCPPHALQRDSSGDSSSSVPETSISFAGDDTTDSSKPSDSTLSHARSPLCPPHHVVVRAESSRECACMPCVCVCVCVCVSGAIVRVARACGHCKKAKARCDLKRPCDRYNPAHSADTTQPLNRHEHAGSPHVLVLAAAACAGACALARRTRAWTRCTPSADASRAVRATA